jgi:hypothetical protein
VSAEGNCEKSPGPIYVALAGEGGATVYVSGDIAVDGMLKSVQQAVAVFEAAEASATANVDVIATVNGTWSRFDLGGYKAGEACNFWGLITPGT